MFYSIMYVCNDIKLKQWVWRIKPHPTGYYVYQKNPVYNVYTMVFKETW